MHRIAAFLCVTALSGCDTAPPSDSVEQPASVSQGRFEVERDGHALVVHHLGGPEPRGVVLLVHGMTWSSEPAFDLGGAADDLSFVRGLVERGIDTYAVDLRGYGATERDADGFASPNEAADDVLAVARWIEERDGRFPTLLGWSLGSWICQLAAHRDPDGDHRTVLYGWPGNDLDLELLPAPTSPRREATTAEDARSDFLFEEAIDEADVDLFVETALRIDPIRADWSDWDELGVLHPADRTRPVLVLRGALDPIAEDRPAHELFTGLRATDLEEVVVPGCGHAAHLEIGRAACLDAVARFAARTEG